jgi:HKD family nuclease
VGDYLQVTEPVAPCRLSDLALVSALGSFDLRVYEAQDNRFHLKSYVFLTGRGFSPTSGAPDRMKLGTAM